MWKAGSDNDNDKSILQLHSKATRAGMEHQALVLFIDRGIAENVPVECIGGNFAEPPPCNSLRLASLDNRVVADAECIRETLAGEAGDEIGDENVDANPLTPCK